MFAMPGAPIEHTGRPPIGELHPELRTEHVARGELYADRAEAIGSLPPGGHVAEVGVAVGDFSEVILEQLRPARFDAIDTFELHQDAELWGRPTTEWFDGRSHREHYERRFAEEIAAGTVYVHQGDSSATLAAQPDESYDMIYIDGDHSMDGVRRDAQVSTRN